MSRQITAILIDEHAATIVSAEGDRVEHHAVTFEPDASLSLRARAIAEAMDAIGKRNAEVVLAIPSSWCLAAAVEVGDGAKRTHEALAYRLEEHLPIAAEDFVADFPPENITRQAVTRASSILL